MRVCGRVLCATSGLCSRHIAAVPDARLRWCHVRAVVRDMTHAPQLSNAKEKKAPKAKERKEVQRLEVNYRVSEAREV